jgi:hypothetical protein
MDRRLIEPYFGLSMDRRPIDAYLSPSILISRCRSIDGPSMLIFRCRCLFLGPAVKRLSRKSMGSVDAAAPSSPRPSSPIALPPTGRRGRIAASGSPKRFAPKRGPPLRLSGVLMPQNRLRSRCATSFHRPKGYFLRKVRLCGGGERFPPRQAVRCHRYAKNSRIAHFFPTNDQHWSLFSAIDPRRPPFYHARR